MVSRTLNPQSVFWGICAFGVGVAVVWLRLETAGAALVTLGFIVAMLISPIAAVTVMLAIAPMRTLIATEAPSLLPLDIGQLAFAAMIASWLFHRFVQRRSLLPALRPNAVLFALAIFLAASGLSVFVAFSTLSWLTEWLKWIQIAILVVIITDLSREYGWRWLVFGLVSAALANAVIGIYEYFGGSGAIHLLIDDRHFRAFGTFGQPNPFGGFMGLVTPLAWMASVAYSLKAWRAYRLSRRIPQDLALAFYYMIAAVVITGALYCSWSRGAWLGFAASAVALILALPRRTWVSLAIVVSSVVLILAVVASGRLPASVVARLSTITDELSATGDVRGVDVTNENYANVERLAHWQAATNMATAYPWLGVGFGNYEVAYPQFSLIYWKLALGHAHNYYLNVLAETGLIGALAYGIMMISTLVLTWRIRRHPDFVVRMISVGLLGSWVYLAVHSLTDNLYVNNLFLHVGALFALVAVLHDQLFRRTHV